LEQTVDGLQTDDLMDEGQLITRVANGDEDALAVLYDRFGQAVYSLCLRIIHDSPTAEELTQEVFVRLWRSAASFDATRAPFKSWLLRIAHNLALNEVRRRQSRPTIVEDGEWGSARSEVPDPSVENDPAGSMWMRERAMIIHRALAALPAPQRRAIELAFYGGLSQVEVAATLGDPLGTVKSRIRVGMRHLREVLAEAGIHEWT
jgi:RNA polymerase sigma-70 factor, ECF subfamily